MAVDTGSVHSADQALWLSGFVTLTSSQAHAQQRSMAIAVHMDLAGITQRERPSEPIRPFYSFCGRIPVAHR